MDNMRTALGLMNLAQSDLQAAMILTMPGEYHNACYHSRQAAKRALKALVKGLSLKAPEYCDLGTLVAVLKTNDPTFPDFTTEVTVLDVYSSVNVDQIDFLSKINAEDAKKAHQLAASVVVTCRGRLS